VAVLVGTGFELFVAHYARPSWGREEKQEYQKKRKEKERTKPKQTKTKQNKPKHP